MSCDCLWRKCGVNWCKDLEIRMVDLISLLFTAQSYLWRIGTSSDQTVAMSQLRRRSLPSEEMSRARICT